MELRRDFDAKRINQVMNDPSVFPSVALKEQLPGSLDLTAAVNDPSNILLMCDEGGLIFSLHEPGVYEVHTQFTDRCRGAEALRLVQSALRWMFVRTDCVQLWSKIPTNNPRALGLLRAIHGKLEFRRESVWPSFDGPLLDVEYFGLSYNEWFRTAPKLEAKGKWFHDRLDQERARLGTTDLPHPEDVAHDRAVGVAVESILCGNVDKGVALYNRWARFAGYSTVAIVARNPLTLFIGDAILQVNGGDFEVLKFIEKAAPPAEPISDSTNSLTEKAA